MKKRLSVVLSIALVFYVCISQHANVEAAKNTNNQQNQILQIENQMDDKIADSACSFIKEKFKMILEMVSQDSDKLNIPADSLKDPALGEPFMIYDLDGDLHYEEIYFPVLDKQSGDVIFTITLFGTTYGWQYKVGTDMVKELNLLEYDPKKPYVFYEKDDEITGQGLSKKVNFSDDTVESGLSKNDFIGSAEEALDHYETPKKVDIEANEKIGSYVPDTSSGMVSELGYYYLTLQNARGQQIFGLCWAASVATIVNYKLDKKITPNQVANAMGIAPETGGSLYQAQSALFHYGLSFIRRESFAPFDLVKLNIQNRSPIYMRGSWYGLGGEYRGHAVTIYGYKEVVGEQSLMIWDPAANRNTGDSYMISYGGAGTVFSSDSFSTIFTWSGTLLDYK